MSLNFSQVSVYLAFGAVGWGLGSILYGSFKRAQRDEGNREGFIESPSTKLSFRVIGTALGSAVAFASGLNSLSQITQSALIVWSPVIFEGILMVSKNHLLRVAFRTKLSSSKSIAEVHAKLSDRLKYSFFVVNIVLTAYIAGKCPEKMWMMYTAKFLMLFPLRIYEFRKQKMHLYNYELCLFVNYALMAYIYCPDHIYNKYIGSTHLLPPTRADLFSALFGLANGPVGWYIAMFDGTLSFFDHGRTTSAIIHFWPPLMTYCIRHFADHKVFPIPANSDGIRPYALQFYASWAAFQYIVVLGLYYKRIQERGLVNVYMESTYDPIRRATHSHNINKALYFVVHGAMACAVICASPLLYNSERAHFFFVSGLAVFAVWNGSQETFDRFREAYREELKARLKIRDEDAEAGVDPSTITKIAKLIVDIRGADSISVEDVMKNGSLNELGVDSMRAGLLGSKLQEEYKIFDLEVGELLSKNVVQIATLVTERAGKGAMKIIPAPLPFSMQPQRPKPQLAQGTTVAEIFLNTCNRMGSAPALADDSKPGGNVMSYSDLKIACCLFAHYFSKQTDLGERVGIMLPASVGSSIAVFASLIAGKIPVMINFTMGAEKIRYTLTDANASRTITSRKFVNTLVSKGVELPPEMGDTLIFMEDILDSFTTLDKVYIALRCKRMSAEQVLKHFNCKHTVNTPVGILFTSGSTANPKGVPLTNKNVIENLKGVIDRLKATPDDIVMAALPPFHSFGFAATTCMPVMFGIRCVYYPNPTAFFDIGRQLARWKPTVYFSTPSWMQKVYSASKDEWVTSLRAVVVGAEACPASLREVAKKKGATVLEGYGITETSPVVCTGRLDRDSVGVGWPINGVDVRTVVLMDGIAADKASSPPDIVRKQIQKRDEIRALNKKGEISDELAKCRLARQVVWSDIPTGTAATMGIILVSGPNVFGNPSGEGYLNHNVYENDGKGNYKYDPYIEYDGKVWYNTEDMGYFDKNVVDEAGKPCLVIAGRVKRFVKRGGEMISLGAIEDAMAPAFPDIEQKRTYAVESTNVTMPDGSQEPRIGALILATAVENKEHAVKKIREALSQKFTGSALNLHMPDQTFLVPAIPMLGTGKLDLQGCKKFVEAGFK